MSGSKSSQSDGKGSTRWIAFAALIISLASLAWTISWSKYTWDASIRPVVKLEALSGVDWADGPRLGLSIRVTARNQGRSDVELTNLVTIILSDITSESSQEIKGPNFPITLAPGHEVKWNVDRTVTGAQGWVDVETNLVLGTGEWLLVRDRAVIPEYLPVSPEPLATPST
jgi:hypothetical protein